LTAAGAALVVAVGWIFGRWRFATFGPDYIPMAPLTAWMIVLLGVALFLRVRLPLARLSRTFGFFTAAFVGLTCLLVGGMRLLGFDILVEHWLAPTAEQIRGSITGRMSPLTALSFLFTAAALGFALRPSGPRRLGSQVAAVSAAIVLLIGLAVVLGYASGLPLLYGSGIIPMAFLTAVSFALLGASLLAAATPEHGWLSIFESVRTGGAKISSRRFEYGLLCAFVLLTGAISVTGWLYFRRQMADMQTTLQHELSAIADLKADQIGNWLRERRGDAERASGNRALNARFQQALANSADSDTRQELLAWMESLRRQYGYERIQLYDPQAAVILSVPPAPALADPHAAEHVRAAVRGKMVIVSDLHHGTTDDEIHIDFLIPIGVADDRDGTVDGVLILHMNANDFLYPLIQTWPMPSRTAETLLVRRDGDHVLYLNELRHRKNLALRLRYPVGSPHLPAAAAVRGEVWVAQGVDYRGVQVLAATRAVPNSPWFLVAKVDQEESFALLRERAWATAVLLALSLAVLTLSVVLLWRMRFADSLRRELASEREHKSLAERIAFLSKHANDIMLFTDRDWRIVDANDRASAAYGYTLAELQRLTLRDLRTPEDRSEFERQARQVDAQNDLVFEMVCRRKDGTAFLAEGSVQTVDLDGTPFHQAILRDITQRRAQEREVARLSRLYATLSQINQTIIRVKSQEELFREVCRVTAESGGFKVVWIGRRDPETQRVVPVARGGDAGGYLDTIDIYADDRPSGRGPVGTCIREGMPCVFNDFANDPRAAPWHAAAFAHGVRSVAASPIHFEGRIWGAFTVYDAESEVFQDMELALLEEAARDVSYAMESLSHAQRRQQAARALRESEEQFRAMFEMASIGMAQADPRTGRWLRVNEKLCSITGYSADEMLRMPFSQITHPDDRQQDWEAFQRVMRGEAPNYRMEKRYVCKDGSLAWVNVNVSVIRDDTGQPTRTMAAIEDITDRKRAEQEREVTVRLLDLLNGSSDIPELMEDVVLLLRDWFGCDAVGVRLRDGDDFPYFETSGFSPAFILAENLLCVRDLDGRPVRDSVDYPVLECMCGKVLRCRFDSAKPFFTARGSFWTNGTSELLGGTPESERQVRTRNRCHGEGYESTALVALRVGQTTYGLLQINDKRPDCFSPERIALLERLGDSVAVAIAHRQSAQKARESEARYRLLADNSEDFVLLNHADGRRLYVSPSFHRATGWTLEELQSADWRTRIHPDDVSLVEQARAANLAGRRTQIEYRMRCKDGSWIWMDTRCRPIADADGQVRQMQLCARDATGRKQAEEEIRRLNTELEQRVQDRTAELQTANQELEAFSYSVSHDLRAPLRAINGYASIVRGEYAQQLDSEAQRFLDAVVAESARMGRLIDDLLAFSRLGRQTLQCLPIDMKALAHAVFAELAGREPERELRLSLEPMPPARGDPSMIRQVWTNLLSNAVKYTGVRPVAEIRVGSRTVDGEVTYFVQDNGAGFDMHYAGKLFGVFQRLHSEDDFTGTGVGLALVQRILHRHGGRIWADARIDAGATFSFTLPHDDKIGRDPFQISSGAL
jgi:PAS domain S-box-containing protein